MLQGLSNAAEERGILELRERFLFMTSSLQMSTLWAETVNQAHSAAHGTLSSPGILTAYIPLPISNWSLGVWACSIPGAKWLCNSAGLVCSRVSKHWVGPFGSIFWGRIYIVGGNIICWIWDWFQYTYLRLLLFHA
jgi:hypothetical protein